MQLNIFGIVFLILYCEYWFFEYQFTTQPHSPTPVAKQEDNIKEIYLKGDLRTTEHPITIIILKLRYSLYFGRGLHKNTHLERHCTRVTMEKVS